MKKGVHILSTLLGVALMSVPALASEGGKAGLPQMDVTFFAGQIFWLAVFFAILFLLMRFIALPPVQQTQEKREQILGGELKAAKEAHANAQTLMTDYEKNLSEARSKAQDLIGQTMKNAVAEGVARQEAHHHEWAERVTSAEAKVAEARSKALTNIQSAVDDLTQSILHKVVGASFSAKRVE